MLTWSVLSELKWHVIKSIKHTRPTITVSNYLETVLNKREVDKLYDNLYPDVKNKWKIFRTVFIAFFVFAENVIDNEKCLTVKIWPILRTVGSSVFFHFIAATYQVSICH